MVVFMVVSTLDLHHNHVRSGRISLPQSRNESHPTEDDTQGKSALSGGGGSFYYYNKK